MTMALFAGLAPAHAQFNVTPTLPTNGEVDVPGHAILMVQFNDVIDTLSVDTDTFTVRGQRYGVYPGTFSFPVPDMVAFDPGVNFLFGESIEVTLSDTIMSSNGMALSANYVVFQFETEAAGCSVFAFMDSGQTLGSNQSFGVHLGDIAGDGDLDTVFANIFGLANRIHVNKWYGGLLRIADRPWEALTVRPCA